MISSNPLESSNEPFEYEITDTIDLHAFKPAEVKSVTETYLREANRKGFEMVRIIHGKGIGVYREIVRSVLRETEFVERFEFADEFSGGGMGATIAYFKQD